MYTEHRPGDPVIDIRGLTKTYGQRSGPSGHTLVLDNLDLTLPAGVHALLGPNGAGKSTLVKILSTLLPFDSGTVRVLGMDPVSDWRRLQPRISLTGQFAAFDDKLSCIENLEMMGELFGLGQRTARTREMELLDRFDLATSRDVRATALSGGMRRKLDIAVGLISSPELVFLDEPTTGLDTRSRQILWDEIRTLAREGTSVLLTTQYLEEADALADQIRVLHGGRIVAGGTADELKSLVGGAAISITDEVSNVVENVPTTGFVDDLAVRFAEIADRHPQATATIARPTLDDVFLQLTRKDDLTS